jgi:mannose-6-phosphate isomerase-like protein (cupin superfamily)
LCLLRGKPMNAVDIQSALKTVSKLEIAEQTTSEDASTAMNMLGTFNQCMMGLVHFSGLTPWERHPDDELLQILEGDVEVILFEESRVREINLHPGSIFIVPSRVWHRQHSPNGVKLMFLTSQEGNEHSDAQDPRAD